MTNGKQRDTLTNEYLTKHFSDNFSLALTSIESAKALIESGKEFRLAQLLDSVAKSKVREEKSCEVKAEESSQEANVEEENTEPSNPSEE